MVSHLNYMDGVHFAVRILGAFGIYYAASDSECIKKYITKNLLAFSFVLNIVLIADFISQGTIRLTHVLTNIIIVCCVVFILNINSLKHFQTHNKIQIFYEICCWLNFTVTCLLSILSGSRLALFFGSLMVVYFLIYIFKDKKRFLFYLFSLLCAALTIILLTIFNVGDSRRMMDKQIYSLFKVDVSTRGPENDKNYNNIPVADTSKYSDLMRDDLMKLGIAEVEKNLFWGTGNVNFDYVVNEDLISQTPHNFILESLICFGLFGTILLAIIALYIICSFLLKKDILFSSKTNLIVLVSILFGYSLFQPTLYNYIILPVAVLTIISLLQYKEQQNV